MITTVAGQIVRLVDKFIHGQVSWVDQGLNQYLNCDYLWQLDDRKLRDKSIWSTHTWKGHICSNIFVYLCKSCNIVLHTLMKWHYFCQATRSSLSFPTHLYLRWYSILSHLLTKCNTLRKSPNACGSSHKQKFRPSEFVAPIYASCASSPWHSNIVPIRIFVCHTM